ncbi:MAG: response regulator, partial [Bacteroidota bacterium]
MSESIRCIIVDDEPLAITIIEKHVAQMPQLQLVASFQNPLEAFQRLQQGDIDLIFLDIQMPVLTGLDFVKALQKRPAVIFTTAFRNYAVESYELDVIDYLVKPITFSRFFTAVNKFIKRNVGTAG